MQGVAMPLLPNVVFDDRVNPESALDEEPDEEVIDVQ
jgi:hypothetical protein